MSLDLLVELRRFRPNTSRTMEDESQRRHLFEDSVLAIYSGSDAVELKPAEQPGLAAVTKIAQQTAAEIAVGVDSATS